MAKKAAKAEKKSEKKTEIKPAAKASPKAKKKEAIVPDVEMPESAAPMKVAAAEKPPKAPKPEKVKKLSKAKVAEAAAAVESNKKWADLKMKYGAEKAVAYVMTAEFVMNTPIQHKIFGWGYVISSENNRLEVLFETGTKQLISNYKR